MDLLTSNTVCSSSTGVGSREAWLTSRYVNMGPHGLTYLQHCMQLIHRCGKQRSLTNKQVCQYGPPWTYLSPTLHAAYPQEWEAWLTTMDLPPQKWGSERPDHTQWTYVSPALHAAHLQVWGVGGGGQSGLTVPIDILTSSPSSSSSAGVRGLTDNHGLAISAAHILSTGVGVREAWLPSRCVTSTPKDLPTSNTARCLPTGVGGQTGLTAKQVCNWYPHWPTSNTACSLPTGVGDRQAWLPSRSVTGTLINLPPTLHAACPQE